MSALPFLSPVAAYAGKVGGGTEGAMKVHSGRKNTDVSGEFFGGRSSTEGAGYVGTVEKGGYGEKEGGVGGASRKNAVMSGGSNGCLSRTGSGDRGPMEGDNTVTTNRKRCLVVEMPWKTEAGENWEGGEKARNERVMGVGVEMNEEHGRYLSEMRYGSNPLFMSPHQDVHISAAVARRGGNFPVDNSNTPLYVNDRHCQDAAYYHPGMESGGMPPDWVKATCGTSQNYSVEEVMGIKSGKTRGGALVKRDNSIRKRDERSHDVNKGDSTLLGDIPNDATNVDNDRKRKLDLKKKIDAAVVLRSLKNISLDACNEVLQSTGSDNKGGFTMCMMSESKLKETVKSLIERLQPDSGSTKNEEAINMNGGVDGRGIGGGGVTPLSSATLQQSQDFKCPQNARPNGPLKAKLKAWLEEHHHNPYPTTGTKAWLAEMTGMTVKQVSTWFMNARARMGLVHKMKKEYNPRGEDMANKKTVDDFSKRYKHDRPAGLQCYYLPGANTYNNPYVDMGGGGDGRGKENQGNAGSPTESLHMCSSATESSLNGDAVMHQDIVSNGEEREGEGKVCRIQKREGNNSYDTLVEGYMEEGGGVGDTERRLSGQDDAEQYIFSPTDRRTSSQGSMDTEVEFSIDSQEGESSRPPKRRRINHLERATLERWLYTHLDNPYPTLPEKVELAKRTNMTIKQVNAWFMNTRARRGLMRL